MKQSFYLYNLQQYIMHSVSPLETKDTVWHPNRSYIQLTPGIIIDSCFPGGNISSAVLVSNSPLSVQVEGNTDINLDTTSKYWLYFRIRGYRKDKPIKFILKNANHLRKYYGQPRHKPYMVYNQEDEGWQAVPNPIDMAVLENGQFQGSFIFQSQKYTREKKINRSTNDLYLYKEQKLLVTTTGGQQNKKGNCYFAIYTPYGCDDLNNFILSAKRQYQITDINQKQINNVYFNDETIIYSFERRKIHLLTITSPNNIESFSERQPIISQQIFPNCKERPFKLKNNPVILITARVHPSETASSHFVEGLVSFLLGDSKASFLLRQLFIFQIIPMLNPDGVEHGNFRFDHQMRNLNRYYGQSSIEKTPSIRAVELIINYYKNKNNEQTQFTQFYQQCYSRLFMYVDVHGHNSAMPSFIYGNHTDKLQHMIENKLFCKLIEANSIAGGFSKGESEFSKKNMALQEKHDQFSKLCSGRVFAGRSETSQTCIFHSYTMEILPYWEQFSKRKSEGKLNAVQYAKSLGRSFLVSLLDLLDLNNESKCTEADLDKWRKVITKECTNELSRKLIHFRRNDSSAERNSSTEHSKAKLKGLQRDHSYLNEYVERWFCNQVLVKHLMSNTELIKQPKFIKLYQKISKIRKLELPKGLVESPRKDKRQNISPIKRHKVMTEPNDPHDQRSDLKSMGINSCNYKSKQCLLSDLRTFQPEQNVIFAQRVKEKLKFEGKVSRQTIQLREDILQLMPKQIIQKQISKHVQSMNKQSLQKQTIESTQRYEKEVLSKIHNKSNNHHKIKNAVFQIKAKQIVPKKKNNSRLLTEITEHKIETSAHIQHVHSTIHNYVIKQKSSPTRNCKEMTNRQRPSFIEQFILKIKEDKEGVNNIALKCNQRQELKQKALKIRPSLRQNLEVEKSLLPILRRNKIFTIINQSNQVLEYNLMGRGYDSIIPSRKQKREEQDNLDEAILRNKKLLAAHKKQEIIRQQLLKKSQKLCEYKN